jgi:pSer/pThr/pTyr-binding forkhead associated (FHA) protein
MEVQTAETGIPKPQTPVVPPTRVQRTSEPEQRCPTCQAAIVPNLPFCGKCGARVEAERSGVACTTCGLRSQPDLKFCPGCGTTLVTETGTSARISSPVSVMLTLLDRAGTTLHQYPLTRPVTSLGRLGADLTFPDDPYLSPLHAQIVNAAGQVRVRDLGSRNGTWLFIDQPHRLTDADNVLIGGQMFRFRRLGYPGPRPPEQDATRRMGSLIPGADIASLTQLRSDGSGRDVVHLSPGRTVTMGREQGDWQFPYDPSMSSLHASVRSEDADFVITDMGSRNGIAIAIRGEPLLRSGSRILVGDQLLKVEFS